TFEEGAAILRGIAGDQFPNLGAADWLVAAKRGWREQNGRLIPTCDPAVAQNLAAVSPDQPIPTMWPQFEALARVPALVIRGANSDILSSETVEAMKARHPDMDVLMVPDQGHAPLLVEPDTVIRIKLFAEKCEAVRAQAAA